MKLILASKSPRRKEILEKSGFQITIEPSGFCEKKTEKFNKIEEIENLIKYNSEGKAKEVFERINGEALVIGADTVVILECVCMNKPRNFSEAFLCLKNLSGCSHLVKTAVSVAGENGVISKIDTSEVYFRELTDEEINKYIEEKNPLDKAGSYGIQDFIKSDGIINEKSFIQKDKERLYRKLQRSAYK
jgi:septum formation protein